MKTPIKLFLITLLFSSIYGYSQIEIYEDTFSAYFYEDENFEIFTLNKDITISGTFISLNFGDTNHYINVIPTEDYSITIVPIGYGEEENRFGATTSRLGVEDDDEDKPSPTRSVNLYPNPTIDSVTIITKQKIKEMSVYNSFGIKLPIKIKTNKINLNGFKKGIYLLKIQLKNNHIITKTIIKN